MNKPTPQDYIVCATFYTVTTELNNVTENMQPTKPEVSSVCPLTENHELRESV